MSEQVAARLVQIADQIRAMSHTGLAYSKDPYDIDRYQKLLRLASELLSMAATQPLEEIQRVILADVGLKTPLTGIDTAVFNDASEVLLIQRKDNQKWAMPGGVAEVGDTPAENAAREVWEETGYRVQITRFLGVFDNTRYLRATNRHGYLLLFMGIVISGEITESNETLDARWFSLDEIPWDILSPGHLPRLRHAVASYRDPATPAYFDP